MLSEPPMSFTPVFNLHTTIGVLLIGLFMSCFLFGIGTVQTYLYFTNFPTDKKYLKVMVMCVWLLEIAHCICICHSFYSIAILGYGHVSVNPKLPNSLAISLALCGIIATIVQSFFVERVRIISGKTFVPVLCWLLSGFRFILTILGTVEAIRSPSLYWFVVEWKWLCASALAVGSAVDLLVAIMLSHYLRLLRKHHLSKGTSFLVDKITAWTIQNGIVTSLAGLLMLACFLSMPGNFVWIGIFMLLARIFSNSLLASLNGRTILRDNGNVTVVRNREMNGRNLSSNECPTFTRIKVNVQKTIEVDPGQQFEHGII